MARQQHLASLVSHGLPGPPALATRADSSAVLSPTSAPATWNGPGPGASHSYAEPWVLWDFLSKALCESHPVVLGGVRPLHCGL